MGARVLLVYPNVWADVFPLSVLLLSAVLKDAGHEVSVFTACDGPGLRPDLLAAFRQMVERHDPQLIAFSVVEDAFPLAGALLDELPTGCGTVMLGGVFPTFAPELTLAHPRVDAVCVGEGEHALRQAADNLATGRNIDAIAGLCIRQPDGAVRRNPPPPLVDLESLPPPDYSILVEAGFPGPIPLIPHRGCPYRCSFCNSPAQSLKARSSGQGHYFRRQGQSHVRAAIEAILSTPGLRIPESGLYFCSDTLLAWTPREFDEFAELYSDFRIPFIGHTTPETVHAGRLNTLAELGMKLLNIGIQHGDEHFRRQVLKRGMSNVALERAMQVAAGSGIFISADAIVGFPDETPAEAMTTFAFMQRIPAHAKNCSIFVPYHGTELRRRAEEKGYIRHGTLARWQPARSQLSMPQFPAAEISRIRSLYQAQVLHAPLIADPLH